MSAATPPIPGCWSRCGSSPRSRAIGSARELERLCKNHFAYQWLCGGVSVNYHMLADFRSQGGEKWDELLTQIVATLMDEGLVTMECVAQDGMRVRANAGKSSFRSGGRLEELLEEAKQQVETLKELAETNPEELTRPATCRPRACGARSVKSGSRQRRGNAKSCAEEARKETGGRRNRPRRGHRPPIPWHGSCKFSDGGYRPAFNVQFATDTATASWWAWTRPTPGPTARKCRRWSIS